MLDIQTLVLINCIINFFNTIVLFLLWRQYRKHFPGLHFLLLDMGLQTTGFLLSLLRNQLPAIISIVLSNVLIMTGAFFVLIGLEIFFQKKGKHRHNYVMLALFASLMIYFALISPNLFLRELCISAMLIIINTQTCWLLLHRIPKKARRIAGFTVIILLAYVSSSYIRIFYLLISSNHPNDFFSSGFSDSLPITLYLVLSVLITISFVALVSRRLLEEIQAEKEKYNVTFQTSPSAILLTKMSDGTIIEVNDGFQRMMGYQAEEVVGKTTIGIKLWNHESDRDAVMGALYLGKDVVQREIQFHNKQGDSVFGLLSSKLIDINNEKCIITNISNVTEMVKMRQDLHDLATHDSLTGLPNRILFYDRFEIAKGNAQRENEKIAVISMDIDFLKRINDEMGHAAGDVVLATVSGRMSNLLRKVDSVARFGGDEFALLIWGMKQIADVTKVVENLQRIISEPIIVGEKEVSVSVSMGIAIYPDDGCDIIELLKQSDTAMYHAKRDGRNNVKFCKVQDSIA